MIRFSWLQFRTQAVAALGALAIVAVALAVTGPHLAHLGIGLMLAAPPVIGMVWGAPLVTRELETGTVRLAWTQGVTRTRWLAVKLAVTGLAAVVTAGLLSLMLTWWSSPVDTAAALKSGNSISFIRIGPVLFGAHTIVALTPTSLYPNLAAGPDGSEIVMPTASSVAPGSWVLSTQTLDSAGHVFNAANIAACQGSSPSQALTCQATLGRLHLRDLISYQPASSFWPLQWYETAIFLGLAALLAALCLWCIRRQAC